METKITKLQQFFGLFLLFEKQHFGWKHDPLEANRSFITVLTGSQDFTPDTLTPGGTTYLPYVILVKLIRRQRHTVKFLETMQI